MGVPTAAPRVRKRKKGKGLKVGGSAARVEPGADSDVTGVETISIEVIVYLSD